MPSCIVSKCGMSTSKKLKEKHANLRFFSFPRDEKMRKKWLLAINRENINIKNARVCSRHFDEKSYKKDWRTEMYNYHPSTARALLPDAVPILNLLPTSKKPNNDPSKLRDPEQMETNKDAGSLDSPLSALQQEVKRLAQENTKLRAELARSKSKKQYELLENECLKLSERLKTCVPKSEVVKLLRRMFTPGQVRAILLPQRRKVLWSAEDISSALALRGVSARAYDYLKLKRNIPLPGQSTLRKWLGRMKLERGLLSSVLRLMEQKSRSMEDQEKVAVLSFGDDDLKKSRVHCVMLRGLIGRWKQPIYCDEKGFGKGDLLELIAEVERVGFRVVAVISGIEQRNLRVWKDLGIGENGKSYFVHEDKKVFVFADISCLFRSLKSYFMESGLIMDGKSITKECLKVEKSRVDLSRDVAKEIAITGGAGDLEGYHWKETTEFIVIINDWFDLFNSSGDFEARENEVKNLERMTQVMEEQRSTEVLGVQGIVIMNNRSLQKLLEYLKETCNIKSFDPKRLNIDPLKHLFSYLNSGNEAKHRHLYLKSRLRWYNMLGDAGSDGDEILIKDLFEINKR